MRSRIGLDHRENIRRAKRLGNAVHHVNDLPQLLEPPAILGMALHDVLAQHTRGPAPELHAAARLDAVPNRDDDIEVVAFKRPLDFPIALYLNLCKFCTSCLSLQLTFLIHIRDVTRDDRPISVKKHCHLIFREPNSLFIHAHGQGHLLVRRLEQNNLVGILRHSYAPRSSTVYKTSNGIGYQLLFCWRTGARACAGLTSATALPSPAYTYHWGPPCSSGYLVA